MGRESSRPILLVWETGVLRQEGGAAGTEVMHLLGLQKDRKGQSSLSSGQMGEKRKKNEKSEAHGARKTRSTGQRGIVRGVRAKKKENE